MNGCFPQHQDEAAAFLEADVDGSDDEVFVLRSLDEGGLCVDKLADAQCCKFAAIT